MSGYPEPALSPESSDRLAGLYWLLPTLVGAALRLTCLGRWSMWADEVATLRDAADLSRVAGYPIGYALIGLLVRHFGNSEWIARFVPALAGILSVPLTYVVGKRVAGRRAALWASWMLALSSYHIYYSQFARYYTLVALFSFGAVFCVHEGVERADGRRLAAAVALLALAFFTHWSAGLLAPATFVYACWRFIRSDRLKVRHLLILLGPLGLGAALLAPWALEFLGGWGPWRFSASAGFLAGLKLVDRFGAIVLVLAAYGVWHGWRAHRPVCGWLLSFAAIPMILLILLVSFTRGGTRFALCALGPALLIAGLGLDHLTRTRHRVGTVAACLLFAGLGTKVGLYFTVEKGQRPRWREATAYVADRREGEILVATSPPIVEYYGGGPAIDLTSLRDLDFAENLAREANEGLWLVVEHTRNVAPPAPLQSWIERHATLEKRFPVTVRILDYGLSVYRIPPRRTRPRE